MPTLERLARERAHSLAVLAISVDVVGKEQVQAFARELGLSLTILLDTEGLAVKLYRVRGIPSTFIVDRAGVLRYREIGYRDWTTAESRAIVDGALRPR
jgi:peroxiredoxin